MPPLPASSRGSLMSAVTRRPAPQPRPQRPQTPGMAPPQAMQPPPQAGGMVQPAPQPPGVGQPGIDQMMGIFNQGRSPGSNLDAPPDRTACWE